MKIYFNILILSIYVRLRNILYVRYAHIYNICNEGVYSDPINYLQSEFIKSIWPARVILLKPVHCAKLAQKLKVVLF